MLPSKNRIQKKDFPTPKRQGFTNQQIRVSDVSKTPLFSGVFYKNDGKKGEIRVSVIVSKKTAKTAVSRNLMRRRFYEIIQPYLKSFTQHGSLVLYPKKETSTIDFLVLKNEIEFALRKAKLII